MPRYDGDPAASMTVPPPGKPSGSDAVGSRSWRPSVPDPPPELNIFTGASVPGSSSVTRSPQTNELLSNGHPVGPDAGATRLVAMAAPRVNDPDLRMPHLQRRRLPRMML
eukprot:4239989-Pyramimonas_sp.AAC.1